MKDLKALVLETSQHLNFFKEMLEREPPKKLAGDLTFLIHLILLLVPSVEDKDARAHLTDALGELASHYPVASKHLIQWMEEVMALMAKKGEVDVGT